MGTDSRQGLILVVGDAGSVVRARLDVEQASRVEYVSSLAEAIEKHRSGAYERVIVDPSAIDASEFQILAEAPGMPRQRSEVEGTELSRRQQLLGEIAEDFLAGRSLEQSLRRIVAAARDLVSAGASVIGVFDEAGVPKEWVCDLGEDQCGVADPVSAGSAMPEFAARYGQGTIIRNDLKRLRPVEGHIPLRNVLSVGFPVTGGTAALIVANKRRDFTRADSKVIERLTQFASIIIHRAWLGESELRAHAESERHAAELDALFSSIVDAVTFVDAEGRVLLANDAARAYFEVPDGEDTGARMAAFRFETMSGRPMTKADEATSKALAGETLRDIRYRMISPGGRETAISVSASPVRDSKGRVVGATTIFRDISERFEIERRRDELYQREHRISRILQQALIPPDVPQRIGSYGFAVEYKPALSEASVGGDFYDIFTMGYGKIGVLIGDVSGKGLAAAIRVAAARYSIRSYAYLDPRPGRVMTLANRALCCDSLDESGMLTAFFVVIDGRVGVMSYANAGHERPIVFAADGEWQTIRLPGLPLGVSESVEYAEDSLRLNPGDRVVLVTDGITEARCRERTLFGRGSLIECVKCHCRSSITEIATAIMHAAREHADGKLQDDSAVLVFEQCADKDNR